MSSFQLVSDKDEVKKNQPYYLFFFLYLDFRILILQRIPTEVQKILERESDSVKNAFVVGFIFCNIPVLP